MNSFIQMMCELFGYYLRMQMNVIELIDFDPMTVKEVTRRTEHILVE